MDTNVLSRRHFIGSVTAAALTAACREIAAPQTDPGRLIFRPTAPTGTITPGVYQLGSSTGQRAQLRVPAAYRAGQSLPLIIAFHGAGGRASDWVNYAKFADDRRMIFLAPDSTGLTWDAINGDFGVDVTSVSSAILGTMDLCSVDASRIALMGFSDGASYALSLALRNGDLLRAAMAHSPGFYTDGPLRGKPSFFISHGKKDSILDIDYASRIIVPKLRAMGDEVRYVEFDGEHELPLPIENEALDWLASFWA